MTEKERPLAHQPDHIQNPSNTPEDEIDLVDLLEALFKKKALIAITTFICTLLSILYAQSIVPTYKATIGFLPVGEKSLTEYFHILHTINGTDDKQRKLFETENKATLLSSFFTIIKSYRTQEKVFIENNFLKRFVDNKPSANMEKIILAGINRSIQKRPSGNNDIYLEMVGTKPEVMSDFLNSLAETAKNDTINSIRESLQQAISIRIKEYSLELNIIRSIENGARSKQISHLSKNLEIAKNLGVVENNYSNPDAREKLSLPLWYLHGQRALEQEIATLKSKPLDDQHIVGAPRLISNIENLSKLDLSKVNLEPVLISQISTPPAEVYGRNKIQIIAIGMALGLFIGVLAAFSINFMAYLRVRSTPHT